MAMIDTPIVNELCELSDANERRVQAIAGFGFTERQARFLVLVMRHSGVCVPRQYATLAGIANGGRKCNALFERCVGRGLATAIPCVHNRARVYHVHAPELYRAIGEPASRYRRPVPVGRVAERLMLLDAVLTTPDVHWLTTPAEKRTWLQRLGTSIVVESGRETNVEDDSTEPCGVRSTSPISVDPIGRVVLLYVATEPWTARFRTFLRQHLAMLRCLPAWSVRVAFPRPLDRCCGVYEAVLREESGQPDQAVEWLVLPHGYRHLAPLAAEGPNGCESGIAIDENVA